MLGAGTPTHVAVLARRLLAIGVAVLGVALLAASPAGAQGTNGGSQWATNVTGASWGAGTMTFGSSGVTAALGAVSSLSPNPNMGAPYCVGQEATNLALKGNAGGQATGADQFYTPSAPDDAVGVCQGHSGGAAGIAATRTVAFNKPVLAPVFIVNNLDATDLTFDPGPSAGAIALTELSSSPHLDVVGTNILRNANLTGSAGCHPDATSTNNSGCGSFRMTEAGGAVNSFTMVNTSRAVGSDGWLWSLWFPTAPLTKAFSPARIRVGQTSTLTFTIANPSSAGQPTLTPLDFTDDLPTGVTLADGGVTDNGNCGTPSVTDSGGGPLGAGDTGVEATDITVAAGATCTITVNVTSTTVGTYVNDNDNLSTNIGNLVPDATTTLVVEGEPWDCDAFGYLFQTDSATPTVHDVIQIDLATGETSTMPGGTPATMNAVGYNVVDDYFYGWDLDSGQVVRINNDRTLTPLGVPTGPGGTAQPSHIGDVDPSGHYWTSNATTWWEIDLTGPTPVVVDSGPITAPAGLTMGADWGWINGSLYMVGFQTINPTTRQAHLLRFNPATGVLSDAGVLNFNIASGVGAVYVDASGYLYASDNGNGRIYRINTTTRQSILVSNGPASTGNDGARCANAPIPTITVTKTVNGRVRPADQFTVAVVKPDGTTGDAATTTGAGTTASTVDFPASQGKTYTLTDAMAVGSPTPLGEYTTSIACADGDGNAVATGGTGPSWTLDVAEATNYTCNVTNQAVADLQLEKTAASSPIVAGGEVTWTLRVTNNGPSTSIGETITDQLPAEVTFSSASPGCSEANGTVTCAVGEVAPGASKEFTITGQIASSLDQCLRNRGTVSGQFDPDTSNNSSEICTPVVRESGLSMTKVASTTTVAPGGGQVMYTLVVRNAGPSDDSDVKVSDPLPAGLTLVSANPSQGSCTTTNNVVSCDLGTLREGGSAQVLVTVNTTSTAGCITNTARVSGESDDPDPADNQASARVCIEERPPARFDLKVEKTANKNAVVVGKNLTYTITVTNAGPDAAPDAKVTDTFNRPATLVSVETTQGTCTDEIPLTCKLGAIPAGGEVTITVTIKLKEAGGGQTNAASVTSCCGTDGNPNDNLDKHKVRGLVKLKITKTSSRTSVQAGETFSYRIRVRNLTRGAAARNVKVCDRLPSGLSFVSSKPKAKLSKGRRCWTIKRLGGRKSKTFRVTVRAADGASGRKVNRATATSRDARKVTARDPVRIEGGGVRAGGITG